MNRSESSSAIRHDPQPVRPGATVTVVIACYNYEHYLPQAVASALDQRDVAVDVVIVDDRSTDGSLAVARTLAEGESRITVIASERNGGAVAAFNRGLAEAKGEFLVRLDADDLLTPGALGRAVAVMQQLPEVGLVYGHPIHFEGSALPPARTEPTAWTVWDGAQWMALRCVRGSNVITSPEVVLRRSVVDEVGGLRPLRHAHDMEWWLRIATRADVAYLRGVDQAWHREHAASLSTTAAEPRQILGEVRNAFDALFDGLDADFADRARLQAGYRRALAGMALAYARTDLDRGRVTDDVHALLAYARETDPSIVHTRDYIRTAWRAEHPPRVPALTRVRGAGSRLRRRLTYVRAERRWRRTGLYEPLRLHPAEAGS